MADLFATNTLNYEAFPASNGLLIDFETPLDKRAR